MIDEKRIVEIIKYIPDGDLCYLWEIGQDHDYACIRGERTWNLEDEFWRQIGYAMRIRG